MHPRVAVCVVMPLGRLSASSPAFGADIRPVGVLEENSSKYSRCVGMSEDGIWVVGNSKKTNMGGTVVAWPFCW